MAMKLKSASIKYVLIMMFTTGISFAQNPIITDIFSADPAVLVYKDTVFLYAGHDAEFLLIPYYLWSNRGNGNMKVWFPRETN
jgi:hypothetical protein